MIITIVGFGETGASITALLINQNACYHINVMDPGVKIHGRLLDMQHAAATKLIAISLNQTSAFEESTFVFYCAGTRNLKNTNRLSTLKINKDLIHQIFDKIAFKTEVKIIVITNPVELISAWISGYFKHRYTVIGTGTYLDTVRFQFILAKHFNCQLSAVKTLVLGEHGDSMTPILSKTSINNKKLNSCINAEELAPLIESLKASAKEIRKTEEATKHGVAQCAVELMNHLNSASNKSFVASVKVPDSLKKKLNLKSDAFMSLPCHFSKNKIEVSTSIQVDESELEALKKAATVLDNAFKQ